MKVVAAYLFLCCPLTFATLVAILLQYYWLYSRSAQLQLVGAS